MFKTKKLTRRNILKHAAYGGLAALAPQMLLGGCRFAARQKSNNIIFIVIDSLRADHLGSYGYKRNITPNIDSLAADGLLFKNANVTAPWTLPSVASMLTSQYPSTLGITEQISAVGDNFPIFPEILKQNNFTTSGIVSHTLLSSRLGFARGFDSYDEKSVFGHEGISSGIVTDKAISFLKGNHEKPFFLFLHYFDPHYDYLLHKKYNFYPSYRGKIKSGHPIMDLWRQRHKFSADDINYLVSLYDSEIAHTDEHIARVLDHLKKAGIYDDSIVVVTADHGEEFMERGWIGHTITLNRELLQVPLIIKLPENKNRIIDTPVGLIDIAPTLCKYLGIKIPKEFDGKALDIEGTAAIDQRPIFSETFNSQTHQPGKVEPIALRSIILDKYKLIYNQRNESVLVYDIEQDPDERNDLSAKLKGESRKLKTLLSGWIDHVEAKRKRTPRRDPNELFTPEQRKHLESLGYL